MSYMSSHLNEEICFQTNVSVSKSQTLGVTYQCAVCKNTGTASNVTVGNGEITNHNAFTQIKFAKSAQKIIPLATGK